MKIFLIIILSVLSVITSTLAQSSSAYTRYGIGDLEFGYSSKMIGVGEIGTAQLDPDHLAINNPASWSALNRTRVEISIGYKGITLSDQRQSVFTSETEFKGFTLGFPVSKDYGIGLVTGLVPYSRTNYKCVKSDPSYNQIFEGKGGLSKLFLGSSVYLPFNFIAGASLDYYFGKLSYTTSIDFNDDNNIPVLYDNTKRVTGFGLSAGLITPNLTESLGLNIFSDLRLAFSLSYIPDLNVDTLLTSKSLSQIDTTYFGDAKMKIPLRIHTGISFVFSELYNINMDCSYQPWTEYRFADVKDENLRDAFKLSAAFEYIPKKTLGMTIWEQIIWRFGLSFEQTQYKFDNIGIDEQSIFGGLSYPLGLENSIDFAVKYSIRGTTENNLIKENSIRFILGISFGELWFLRFDK